MDVVEAICGVELFDSSVTGYTPPKEDICILSVKIGTYSAEDSTAD